MKSSAYYNRSVNSFFPKDDLLVMLPTDMEVCPLFVIASPSTEGPPRDGRIETEIASPLYVVAN
ncbi:MAG: hypothetical protein FJ023_02465 [Chloroflexi bacterium]|nr:hypothetical protein [Chloroflexota bacterium]